MIDINVFVLGKPISNKDMVQLSNVIVASRKDRFTNKRVMEIIADYVKDNEVHFDTRKELNTFLKKAKEIVG